MNVIKKELKMGRKVFIFWILGLAFLILAGMTKFLGFSMEDSGVDIMALFDKFPKVVLSVFGMNGVDIQSLGGYYSVLEFYVVICGMVYGLSLGSNTITRELIDKTYEFLYTKPCTKSYLLNCKVSASLFYLTLFAIMNMFFSMVAMPILGIENTIPSVIVLYSIVVWCISVFCYFLGTMMSVLTKNPEVGNRNSYLCFGVFYVLAIVYDLIEKNSLIKWLTPIKYFEARDLIAGNLDFGYVVLCIGGAVVFYMITLTLFKRRWEA